MYAFSRKKSGKSEIQMLPSGRDFFSSINSEKKMLFNNQNSEKLFKKLRNI